MTTEEALFATLRRLFGPLTQLMVDEINKALHPETDVPRISPRGLDLIKRSESLRLKAYRCPAGIPTIGWGSTGEHVQMGMTITEAQAEEMLRHDLDRFERGVAALAPVTTQGQFDALVSFAFNVGLGALESSTLLRLHNAGKYDEAADQFQRWNKGGGRVLPGLMTRRADEAALYRGRA